MAATSAQIKEWFEDGVAEGQKQLIVRCDTFSYDDFPVYAMSAKQAKQIANGRSNMEKTMEVYDLTADMQGQLDEDRALNYCNDGSLAPGRRRDA